MQLANVINPTKVCANCKHSVKEGGNVFCRRFPPTIHAMLVPGPNGQPTMHKEINFPPVRPDWTCGEHKPGIEIVSSL